MRDELNQANNRNGDLLTVISKLQKRVVELETGAGLIEAAEEAELIEVAEELADLMDDVVRGNYKPDSFTTQPLRRALRAAGRSSTK